MKHIKPKNDSSNTSYDEFGFTKFVSWSTLAVILGSGILLSIIITNSTKTTLLEKQQEFALLLAENLNHQIYTRFYVPTILRDGHILLKKESQYSHLDQVIQSTTHGLHMVEIRIYDLEKVITYSTNNELLGREDLSDAPIAEALESGEYSFSIDNETTFFDIVTLHSNNDGVILETVYPLRIERSMINPSQVGPVIGVLKLYQDITEDYRTVVRLQVLIIITTVITSLLLFLTLLMIIRRVSRINATRLAEKEKMEKQLAQNEKLVTIGRMVAGVAHEIRNPLGIIRSSAELLLKKSKDENSLTTKILNAIYSESKRLSQTVSDFLDYARPKPPKREKIDFVSILEQALVFLQNEFDKNSIEVIKNYSDVMIIEGDKDLLYRAVYNILINAIQAMDEEGILEISSEYEDQYINIIFNDTGTGFDENVLNHIGEPFMTTKDYGTGLGLTIVINIIESSNGEIIFDNNDDGGARITIKLNKYQD